MATESNCILHIGKGEVPDGDGKIHNDRLVDLQHPHTLADLFGLDCYGNHPIDPEFTSANIPFLEGLEARCPDNFTTLTGQDGTPYKRVHQGTCQFDFNPQTGSLIAYRSFISQDKTPIAVFERTFQEIDGKLQMILSSWYRVDDEIQSCRTSPYEYPSPNSDFYIHRKAFLDNLKQILKEG